MVVDSQGKYVLVNQAALSLFGATREEILGHTISDFVAPMRKGSTEKLWGEFRENGNQRGVFRISRPNGVDRIIRYEAISDFLPGLSLSIAHDITEDQ
jgi:PAS domain S-box-containing protein